MQNCKMVVSKILILIIDIIYFLESEKCAEEIVHLTLNTLFQQDFIGVRTNSDNTLGKKYFATQLGTATVASALTPEDAIVVFTEFQKARKAFVLENELHLIYLVSL